MHNWESAESSQDVTQPLGLLSPQGGLQLGCVFRATPLREPLGGNCPPPSSLHTGGLSNCVHATWSARDNARARVSVDVIPRKHPHWDLPSELRARTAQAQSAARRRRSWRALGQPNRPPNPAAEVNLQPAEQAGFSAKPRVAAVGRETPRCWGWGQPRRAGMDLSRW